MSVSPYRVFEKPAQQRGNLPVLILLVAGRDQSCLPEYPSSHFDGFRHAVAGPFVHQSAIRERHRTIMPQRIWHPQPNIAHFFKKKANEDGPDAPYGDRFRSFGLAAESPRT
jgi:hypothetical protein